MKQELFQLLFLISTILSAQKVEEAIDETLYAINYPTSWKIGNIGRNNVEYYLFASPIKEDFRSNINLVIQNLDGMNLDLTEFTKISEKEVNINGKLISSELKIINNQRVSRINF